MLEIQCNHTVLHLVTDYLKYCSAIGSTFAVKEDYIIETPPQSTVFVLLVSQTRISQGVFVYLVNLVSLHVHKNCRG